MTARARKGAPRAGRGTAEDPDRQAALDDARPAGGASRTGDLRMIADYLGGDPGAAESIARWIAEAAGRYRRRLPTEWEDLLQDLLVEVHTTLQDGAFRGECRLRTFVWRIAHYRCLNRVRDLARRRESALGDEATELPDPGRPLLDRLVARQSEDLLRRFLETVSEDCRRLWQPILEGRSYREMSRESGVSEGALRVRVLRCRQRAVALWRAWLESQDG